MNPVAVEASLKKKENEVWRNLYPDFGKILIQTFSVGDNVRITKNKNLFDNGFTPHRTQEVFRISKIVLIIPITYKIIDLNGEEMEGLFYEQELQKRTHDIVRFEKILKR